MPDYMDDVIELIMDVCTKYYHTYDICEHETLKEAATSIKALHTAFKPMFGLKTSEIIIRALSERYSLLEWADQNDTNPEATSENKAYSYVDLCRTSITTAQILLRILLLGGYAESNDGAKISQSIHKQALKLIRKLDPNHLIQFPPAPELESSDTLNQSREQYIYEAHKHNKLSFVTIAASLGISPSWAGRLFRRIDRRLNGEYADCCIRWERKQDALWADTLEET